MPRSKSLVELGFLGISIEKKLIDALKKKASEKHRGNVSYLVNEILNNFFKDKK